MVKFCWSNLLYIHNKTFQTKMKFFQILWKSRCNIFRGVGTVKFQVKQLKKILDKFANLLNFLHFQPLISGEAAASPASPVPTPLSIHFLYIIFCFISFAQYRTVITACNLKNQKRERIFKIDLICSF